MFDIISLGPSHTTLCLSHTHLLKNRLFAPFRSFGKGRKRNEGRNQDVEKQEKREVKHTKTYIQRLRCSLGWREAPQVNQGHKIIIGGPRVETDLYSACTKCPCWHCFTSFTTLILQRKSVSVTEENHLAASRYCRLNCTAAECCNRSQFSALLLAILQ